LPRDKVSGESFFYESHDTKSDYEMRELIDFHLKAFSWELQLHLQKADEFQFIDFEDHFDAFHTKLLPSDVILHLAKVQHINDYQSAN
jgi:hypothetical protein